MASGLFALLDDIATLLEDVSVMTKVATKKTAGVLGDDLALNAQQVSGIDPDRELPVVWAVAKGSLLNKAILVPGALLVSTFAPWAVMPLMMVGGAYLCFEGVEKLAHKYLHPSHEDAQHHAELLRAVQDESVDIVAFERDKIRGAVRTDFILSAEIIVITLGTIAEADFTRQLSVLVAISLLMTVGVYGLVAGIVKLDDLGLLLARDARGNGLAKAKRAVGVGILRGAPYLMKFISIAGTAAMFLVGGGILVHGIPALHHLIEPYAHGGAGLMLTLLFDAAVGIAAGIVVLAAVKLFGRLRARRGATPAA